MSYWSILDWLTIKIYDQLRRVALWCSFNFLFFIRPYDWGLDTYFLYKAIVSFFIKGNVIYVAHNHGMAYFSDIPKYDFLILIYQKGMTKYFANRGYLLTYTFSDHSIVIMLQLSNAFWPIRRTSSYYRCNFASM